MHRDVLYRGAFPLNKASGSVSTSIKEETITLVETSGAEQATQGSVVGTYTRDEDNIEVFLPMRVCERVFKTSAPRANLESRSSTMRFSLARYERQLVSS